MKPSAIVYTSNTGNTAEYARLLSDRIELPAYTLSDAADKLTNGSCIIYLGWLMAGRVQGYKKAAKRYQVQAVCGVGMGATGSQLEDLRKANRFPAGLPLFTLQGGFDITKLRGVYKLMMTVMSKTAGKGLSDKPNRTPEEDTMLKLLTNGGSYVSKENLAEIEAWYRKGRSIEPI